MSLQDEFDVVSSVYCREGEFACINPASHEQPMIRINLKNLPALKASLNMSFQFTDEYPACLPHLTIHSPAISRGKLQILRKEITIFANEKRLLNTEMILELITWLKENIFRFTEEDSRATPEISPSIETCLLSLDHMRSKDNYVKLLTKWSQQLQLRGMVVFYKKSIFIILQGTSCDVSEYISRMKTRKVDVDSAGRACKEKLLTVLVRSTLFKEIMLEDFSVRVFTNSDMLESSFAQAKLHGLYAEFIMPIIMP